MKEEMMLEDALNVLEEMATGEKESLAFNTVKYNVTAYRSLYEGAEKRLVRYRDVASKPDIYIPEQNKDKFRELTAAVREYRSYEPIEGGEKPAFDEWLFTNVEKRDTND